MTNGLDEFRRVFAEHDLGLSDALTVLNSHFRQAMQTPGDGAVVYSHDGRPALALAYSTKGNVTSLAVGRGLRDDDLERLIAAFTAPRPRHVMTVVIFSDVPALGFWRYRDLFRVLPLPPGAPRPRHVFDGVHPLLLEVGYDGSDSDQVDEYRGAVATREVNRLMSGLLRGTEDRLGHFARSDWFVVREADEHRVEHLASHFGQVGYFLGGERGTRSPHFADVPADVPPLALNPKDVYYARRGISASDAFVLPDSFDASLDNYYGLPRSEQDRALRWCHWLNHARQVSAMSPSASAIAAVRAVESLLPPGDASIGQRFKQFLEKYAPGETNDVARKQLYRFRSKPTHGGALLVGELRQIAFGDFMPRSWDERDVVEQAV
jgi:hypothetical protein